MYFNMSVCHIELTLWKVDLVGVDLVKVDMVGVDLVKVDMVGVDFMGVGFMGIDLVGGHPFLGHTDATETTKVRLK